MDAKPRTAMKYTAGLGVCLEQTGICIVDGEGTIVVERKITITSGLVGTAGTKLSSLVRLLS